MDTIINDFLSDEQCIKLKNKLLCQFNRKDNNQRLGGVRFKDINEYFPIREIIFKNNRISKF